MSTALWNHISHCITETTHSPFSICDRHSVGGGSINQAYCLDGGDKRFFVKLNQADKIEMFVAEEMGLREISATQTIQVPHPLCVGCVENHSYIVLEWIDCSRNVANWHLMGQQLAQLHRQGTAQAFGWHRANTIGETPQPNPWVSDWRTFFTEHRIQFQLSLAQRNGGSFSKIAECLEAISHLLGHHSPAPSLVHGDLWSGNAAFTLTGQPIILDPATYYGDREVDIAMTELFGGFPAAFYQGYQETWPLTDGYQQRKILYNLYHVLNHFNLFGGSYQHQAQQMMNQLLQTF